MNEIENNTIPKVDVGIPALNEAANIQRVLASIVKQDEQGFKINNIILVSDASTDNTVQLATQMHIPSLKILENTERQGPALCWGHLFQESTADILILLDADIELTDANVFESLLRPILADNAITLTSGHPIKQHTGTFGDKVMDVSIYLQDYIKLHLDQGHSIYGCHGRITAITRAIFTQIEFPPKHILGNDSYLFLINKQFGGQFTYAPNATVRFKMPQTFKDFAKQQRRFTQTQDQHNKIFGQWIYEEYHLPKQLLLTALTHVFLEHPFYTFWYVLYQLRARIFERNRLITKASWDAPATTKSLD
jgi:glycosyltransferase involved in cell wall biosynthesis